MIKNILKAKLEKGEPVFGTMMQELRSPVVSMILANAGFDFIFIDDVDSFLKSSKNIDKVLICLGFSEKIVNDSLKLLELRKELNRLRKMKASSTDILKKMKRIKERQL